MKKDIILYEVIRYVYGETTPEETKRLEKMLFEDQHPMVQEFYEVAQLKSDLSKIKHEPSRKTVKNILDYSRNWQA
jgi:hypothetical protein